MSTEVMPVSGRARTGIGLSLMHVHRHGAILSLLCKRVGMKTHRITEAGGVGELIVAQI